MAEIVNWTEESHPQGERTTQLQERDDDSSSKPLNALGKQPTHLGQGGAPKKIRRLPEQDADIQDNTPQTMRFTLKDENQNSWWCLEEGHYIYDLLDSTNTTQNSTTRHI